MIRFPVARVRAIDNLDCADICDTTGSLVSPRTGSKTGVLYMVETCALAFRVCVEEREKHAGRHDHCRVGAVPSLRK
ncbi:MAG: hypothetical protein J2P49_01510 [Methylocapsa sp.]|nr:hypothetical protein [Methylocapsa sp.]